MLDHIQVKDFSVFQNETIMFSPGLNVVLGENGTGKSHLLKLAYAVASVSHWAGQQSLPMNKAALQREIARKLVGVFRPDKLGRLVRRTQGRKSAEVKVVLAKQHEADFAFNFSTNSTTEVKLDRLPSEYLEKAPIFIPSREVMTLFPGFTALFRERALEIDETYYDLCLALEVPALRGPRLTDVKPLLDPLERLLHGNVTLENGSFYLKKAGMGKMEMNLEAEGLRKVATLYHLLVNGALRDRSMLFWDEPECNLNPKYLRDLLKILVQFVHLGVQVFIATHSLFVMKELEILLANEPANCRWFGLAKYGKDVLVSQENDVEDIAEIATLAAEVNQADRYDNVFQEVES